MAHIWGAEGNFKGIIDNNNKLWGRKIENLMVCSPIDISTDSHIYVSTRLHYENIVRQLKCMGISEDNIVNVGLILDEMSQKQYFDLRELPHEEMESFVDIGSFDGKTTLQFIKWSGHFNKIYCFEADNNNLLKCRENLQFIGEKVNIIDKAAWSSVGMIGFYEKGNGSSFIDDNAELMVPVTTIDNELKNNRVTFIKMDIEGAEIEAIKGARSVICSQKPKLAIAVYHKKEDIIAILQLVMEYNPNYKFYLRHYSLTDSETVLYAV